MQKYEIPLRVVQHRTDQDTGISSDVLATGRKLFDMMGEDELYQDAPISEVELSQTLRSRPDLNVKVCFEEFLEADFESRLAKIDTQREPQQIPKNYDVPLALASNGELDRAIELMEFLDEYGVKKELEVADFEGIEAQQELIDELIEERMEREIEGRRKDVREELKSAFLEDNCE